MKILYLTLENMSLHKGSVVHIKEIIKGLQTLGHQVDLMAIASNPLNLTEHFYNLHPTAFRLLSFLDREKKYYFLSSLLLFFYLFKILPRYDILYARDFHTVIIAFFPRVIHKKRLIYEINGIASEEQRLRGNSIFNKILTFCLEKAEKWAAIFSDRIVSVTPQISSYLINRFSCTSNKIEVISNGVNTKKFYPFSDEGLLADLKIKLGIKKGEKVIAFVGNLAPWQGVEHLVEVAPFLLKEMANLKFLIVGDGQMRSELENMTDHLKLSKHFVFTGMVDYEHIPSLINIADICVAPFVSKRNRRTGVSPLKIFEYMACGKAIVASRIEGLEFIESEGAGRLVEPEDMASLREGLLDLLGNSGKSLDMGRRGLHLIQDKFNWEKKGKEIEKILEGLVLGERK